MPHCRAMKAVFGRLHSLIAPRLFMKYLPARPLESHSEGWALVFVSAFSVDKY